MGARISAVLRQAIDPLLYAEATPLAEAGAEPQMNQGLPPAALNPRQTHRELPPPGEPRGQTSV